MDEGHDLSWLTWLAISWEPLYNFIFSASRSLKTYKPTTIASYSAFLFVTITFKGEKVEYDLRFAFLVTNKNPEYEAILVGL